jgi:hypothetical protein
LDGFADFALLADRNIGAHHTAHAGRAVAVFDVELTVNGKLAGVTVGHRYQGRDSSTSPGAVRRRRERSSQ